MLDAEQNHLRHDVIEIRCAERAGEAHLRVFIVSNTDEVDVAFAVDLSAGQEEYIDPSLTGAVEQLAPAVSEEIMLPALQQRHVRPSTAALARKQCGRCWDRRHVA